MGEPEPVARKPKETEVPGTTVPFQDRLVKVCRPPADVTVASQYDPSSVPAGRAKATCHPVSVSGPLLVMVYVPSHPVPQSAVLTRVAVGLAARAGLDEGDAGAGDATAAVGPASPAGGYLRSRNTGIATTVPRVAPAIT